VLKEEEIIEGEGEEEKMERNGEKPKRHRKPLSLKGMGDKHTYSDIHHFDHKNSCD
jgi:hypothetical protein